MGWGSLVCLRGEGGGVPGDSRKAELMCPQGPLSLKGFPGAWHIGAPGASLRGRACDLGPSPKLPQTPARLFLGPMCDVTATRESYTRRIRTLLHEPLMGSEDRGVTPYPKACGWISSFGKFRYSAGWTPSGPWNALSWRLSPPTSEAPSLAQTLEPLWAAPEFP